MDQARFCYSVIDGVTDTRPRRIDGDWLSFVMGLATPDIRGDMALSAYRQALRETEQRALRSLPPDADVEIRKRAIRVAQQPLKNRWKAQKDGSAWLPAVFGRSPNNHGNLRHAGNVLALYAAVLDLDDHIDRAGIESALRGYRYAAHSSYTHHPAAEKWRVIIPLREPLPPSCAGALYDYFGQCFGRALDTACRNPDHLYFLPACPPDAVAYYQQFSREGLCFDGSFLQEKAGRQRERQITTAINCGRKRPLAPIDVATLPVSERIKSLITTGQGHYPSRSEAVFAVVQALIRAGLDDERIAAVLLNPAYRISDKPRAKGIAWVRNELARARAKARDSQGRSSVSPQANSESPSGDKNAGSRAAPQKSQATALVEMAEGTALFHDPEGVAYTTLTSNGHREQWPVRSPAFREWLARCFWRAQRKAPSSQALTDALGVIEGQARFEAPEQPVFLRVAGHEGHLYLDLCDADWRAIVIDPSGWRLVSDPPVRFIRRNGMLPLPVPTRGGDLDQLWRFLNVNAEDRLLVLAWAVQALRDRGPYPVLITQGEQGTAKSGLTRCLRALLDPSVATLRTTPREERDLLIAARNSHVIALDNVSGLPPWLSDALCRLATGGGFSTRQLYTDTEEVLIQVQRPILLNGIDAVATRQDLIDRAIILNLAPIPALQRRPEAELWTAFEHARPGILGVLLDAVATALKRLPDTHLPRLPRLADFALWATAAEPGLGAEAGVFLEAYTQNRTEAVAAGLDGSSVAKALLNFCEQRGQHGTWQGSSAELLSRLADAAGTEVTLPSWPRSAKGLTHQLRRLGTALRTLGVKVRQLKSADGNHRLLQLEWVGKPVAEAARETQGPQSPGMVSDTFDESARSDVSEDRDLSADVSEANAMTTIGF